MSKVVTVIGALSNNEKALDVLNKHCEFDLVEMVNKEYDSLPLEKRRLLVNKLVEFGLLEKEDVKKETTKVSVKDDIPSYYYNYDFKMKYLEEHSGYKEETKRVMRVFFRKIADLEKKLGKDFYDFKGVEIEEALKSIKSTTVRSLQNTISLFSGYIDYAIKSKVSVRKENIIHNFSSYEKLITLIDEEASQRMFFTRKEIMDMAMFAENAQDGVILALLYDGVSHKNNFSELVNLKVSDIDYDNKLLNIEGRDLPVHLSDETVILLKNAVDNEFYYSINGDKVREYQVAPTDYVLRGLRDRGNIPIAWRNINQRIIRISEIYEEDYLNATNISISSQINHAYELYMSDKSLGDKAIRMTLSMFNIKVNKSSLFSLKKKIKQYTGVHIAS